MAFTVTKSGGWFKHSEVVTVADTNGDYYSSEVNVIGEGTIMTSVEEETGLVGKIQYTEDDLIGSIGGVGQDPSAAKSSSTQTWTTLEVAANVGDSTIESYQLPANAKKVRVHYEVTAATYEGDLGHAVDIYTSKQPKSDIGFDGATDGIGLDPS